MSKILRVRDENGEGIDYAQYEELVFPVHIDIPRKLKTIREFKYEEEDVFICTYPKSGTHWMCAMLHLLFHAKTKEDILSGAIPMIPFIDMVSTKRFIDEPRPRILASHFRYNRLPVEHVQNGGKIILLLRNPKDAAVSGFYHLRDYEFLSNKESWDHFLKSYINGEVMAGSFFDYVDSWSRVISEGIHKNIILIYYEDLVQYGLRELSRVQKFLGTKRDEESLRLIVHRCSFGNLQTAISSGQMPTILLNTAGNSILLRKGKIGDWKNHFTPQQSEMFDKVCHERLKNTIFKFRYDGENLDSKL